MLDDQLKLTGAVRGTDGWCPKGGKFYTFGDFFYGDNERNADAWLIRCEADGQGMILVVLLHVYS
jgi:hypothetical protein